MVLLTSRKYLSRTAKAAIDRVASRHADSLITAEYG